MESRNMNLDQAIKTINSRLRKSRPTKFNPSWIYNQLPNIYHYIWANARTELGDIDWDKITSKLDREFQRRWSRKRAKKIKTYRNIRKVKIALKPFKEKLYVFISPQSEDDRLIRNIICVTLVRVAQKGNIRAQQELLKLLKYTVDLWIEYHWVLWVWKGYTDDIENKIIGCIRCYRFTGTFTGYLFRTLQYAGRGLRKLQAYSLDDTIFDGDQRRIDSVVQDAETNEIKIYNRTS